MVELSEELEKLRLNLLDQTLRNGLLNYRTSKRRTIEIVDESLKELYDILVLQEKSMRFKATKLEKEDVSGKTAPEEESTAPRIWQKNDPSEKESELFFDNFLNTPYNFEDLNKRLFYAYNQSKSIFEEQGYSVLYIALGFLEWKESTLSGKSMKAPLILVPIELTRTGEKRIFSLKWTGDDIYTNLTLQGKLDVIGVRLPEFEMPEDKSGIDEYFEAIIDAIDEQSEWRVLDESSVDFFNFRKFVMYKDLDPATWPKGESPADHDLIRDIFDPQPAEPNDYVISEDEVDEKVNLFTSYNILDADSSQIAAIQAVIGGKNLVVQGPPGTGKSQTIANIIAELLAIGKSVLFVSEKMAALEVVKSRLDKSDLGDFCLELHSHKAKKTAVLEELRRSINLESPSKYENDQEIHELEDLKRELNAYVTTVHTPIGKLGLSPFELFSLKAKTESHFQYHGRRMQNIRILNSESCTKEQWLNTIVTLKNIQEILTILGSINDNPWRGCNPGMILPPERNRINDDIDESLAQYEMLLRNSQALYECSGIMPPVSGTDINSRYEAAERIANAPQVTEEMLKTSEWDRESPAYLGEILNKIETYNSLKQEIIRIFNDSVFDVDFREFIEKYNHLMKRARQEFSSYYDSTPNDFESIYSHLKFLGRHKSLKSAIISFDEQSQHIFGKYWLGPKSNPQQLKDFKEFCLRFYYLLKKDLVPQNSVIFLENGISANILKNIENSDEIAELIQYIEQYHQLKCSVNAIFNPTILNEDIENLREEYSKHSKKIFKIISFRYKNLKSLITQYYLTPPIDDAQILQDLNQANELSRIQQLIKSRNEVGFAYFGNYWKGPESNVRQLSEISELARCLTDELNRGRIKDTILSLISEGIPGEILGNSSWDTHIEEIDTVIANLAEFQDLDKMIKSIFDGAIEKTDIHEYLFEFDDYSNEIKDTVAPYYCGEGTFNVDIVISYLEDVAKAKEIDSDLRESPEGLQLFGVHWNGVNSDINLLKDYSEWIVHFRHLFNSGVFSELSIQKIVEGNAHKDVLDIECQVDNSSREFLELIRNISECINANLLEVFGDDIESVKYELLHSKLIAWSDSISLLEKWGLYLDRRKKIDATIAAPLGKLVDEEEIEFIDIIPAFEGNFADALLRVAFVNTPLLATFLREIHVRKIEKFRELDKRIIEGNRKRLIVKAFSYKPEIITGVSRNSEVGILLGELHRKRRIMPIRKLMLKAGKLIQGIKPCFMMSPLSIAQFLDPHSIEFDVVLFDEASQVRPEDALGAALRGKQLVVMGDSRQLPPTRFFDVLVDSQEDEEEETALAGDMESILNLCKGSFMTKTLRWHYRSRHESLIAVSNQEFYDNRLYVYPSPMHDSPELGLKFVHLPEAVYDRGKSGVNRIEAQRVARMAVEHFKKYPRKTLGIGTFNVKQQEAILEEIEVLVNQDPVIEQFFKNDAGEDFFVKNIETIQGDERDVIIVSVGFGFDRHGKLSKNFGPINQDGGERRLNVLMTRAREKCVIVANFTARDLQIDSHAPFGLRSLKVFLEFAESGTLTTIERPLEDTESPFEEAVYEFLRDSGYEVHKQVGCAGYRIDLAVVDPAQAGQYIIGIECDGAQYHASKVARDRDRLRQDVLEGLGWTIYRVWSTDWYRNRHGAKEALLKAVERAKSAAKNGFVYEKQDISDIIETTVEDDSEEEIQAIEKETILPSLEDLVREYEYYTSLDLPHSPDLTGINDTRLIKAVVSLVEHEGPIHREAVIQRICDNCGVKRIGKRIRELVDHMIENALDRGRILSKGNFLWPPGMERCRSILRKRTNGETLNIDWISPEEIAEAIIFILEHQHSTQMEDLITQTSRILGFKKTRKNVQSSIKKQIHKMLRKHELHKLPNGMLNIK